MKKLIVEFDGPFGKLDIVDEDGRRCMGLTLGEAIEQIIDMHIRGRERYRMFTPEQNDREREERHARINPTATQENV